MRNFLTTVVAGLLLTAAAASASASVVQPGSVSKTYGTGLSTASTGAGSCDTLNATCIRGTDAAGCTRFSDLFDFHSLNYTSIDHLTLTLTFSATNNAFLFFPEDWEVRFADTTAHGSRSGIDMNSVGSTPTTQSFVLNAAQADVFSNIATNGKMYLWFADEALGANNFALYSAKLDVFGTAVPEPSGIALFGLALGGLAMLRRRTS
jgi:hypothetical protein